MNHTISGSKRSINNFQFDLKYPERSFQEIGKAIGKFIKEKVNKIKNKTT